MRPTLSLLIASAVLALGACAQDVGDVDRTQPNRLKKSLFEGEWFVQKTTFDVPYTAGFTFTEPTSSTRAPGTTCGARAATVASSAS